MRDSTLVKISLAWALIGIFILMVAANLAKPAEISISGLADNIGNTVVLRGEVTRAAYRESVSFIDIKDNSSKATVVLFDVPAQNLSAGDFIAVKGKVSVYKNELELVADKIVCLKCGI